MFQQIRDKIVGLYKQHEIVRNFSAMFGVDVLMRASGFFLLPVYLKLMSQDDFGLYNYLISIITVFASVLNFSLYIPQNKLYHDYPEKEEKGKLLFNINLVLLLGILISFLVIFFTKLDYVAIKFLIKTPINYDKYRTTVALGTITGIYSLLLISYFMTAQMIRITQFFNIAKLLLMNGVVLALLYLGSDQDKVLVRLKYAFLMEMFVNGVFFIFYFKNMTPIIDTAKIKRSLKIALPILISMLIAITSNLVDKYFLEKYGSLGELSCYYLASTIASILSVIYTTFHNIWTPFFFKEKNWNDNLKKTRKVIINVSIVFAILSVGLFLLLKFLLLFGLIAAKYNLALTVLPILLVTQIVSAINFLLANYLTFLEKTSISIYISIINAGLSLFFTYFLVLRYHIYGAAFSTLALGLVNVILYYFFLKFNMRRISNRF